MTAPHFQLLYPDVDPRTPLPATTGERLSLTVAVMVLVFGAAAGDPVIGGGGLALTLLSIMLLTGQTARRIRHEARQRFPEQPWAEYEDPARRLHIETMIPAAFILLAGATLAVLTWVPEDHTLLGAALAAALAAAAMLLLPGLSPLWARERRR